MTALRTLLGFLAGFGLGFGNQYLIVHFVFGWANGTALAVGAGCGVLCAAYSALAFGRGVYGLGVFSILGYILDMSWSLLNTAASFLIWIPACMMFGGDYVEPDDNSKRSGTFVYEKNPRGGGYAATTIGTTIGGGWSTHEEIHVWQARIFGPFYIPVYLLSLVLNILFRLVTGKLTDLTTQAYYRICFEDWAYSGGSGTASTTDWKWGGWFLWFFLSFIYVGITVSIVVGIVAGTALVSIIGAVALVAYSLIRTFTPVSDHD
jgi:hypothetical protein